MAPELFLQYIHYSVTTPAKLAQHRNCNLRRLEAKSSRKRRLSCSNQKHRWKWQNSRQSSRLRIGMSTQRPQRHPLRRDVGHIHGPYQFLLAREPRRGHARRRNVATRKLGAMVLGGRRRGRPRGKCRLRSSLANHQQRSRTLDQIQVLSSRFLRHILPKRRGKPH